jgi:biotin carboxyl carrier protein
MEESRALGGAELKMIYEVALNGQVHRLELKRTENGWGCTLDGKDISVDVVQISADAISLLLNGKSYEIRRDEGSKIFVENRPYEVIVTDPRSWRGRRGRANADSGARKLTASMPGKVVRLLAAEGDEVQAGQGIVVIEAMKMQNEIRSPKQGRVQKLLVKEGTNVNAGEVLALVE